MASRSCYFLSAKSVCCDETSKDARFSLLKKLSVLLLHTHPKEVSNTVQPRQKSA